MTDNRIERVREVFASTAAKRIYVTTMTATISVAILWTLWRYAGPLNAIVYTFTFVSMLALFPTLVALAGSELPGSHSVSKLHFILGALSFGRTILVDFGDRWELCPAEKDRVYIDSEWYDIDGGRENWSMLGWRPFAIARFKDDETLLDVRADTKADRIRGREATADGGAVTRGGVDQRSRPAISGADGEWLIDLKRVFTRGIRRMGAIDLIETAEEVAQREQARTGLVSGYQPVIGAAVGLVFGVIVGYAFFAAG